MPVTRRPAVLLDLLTCGEAHALAVNGYGMTGRAARYVLARPGGRCLKKIVQSHVLELLEADLPEAVEHLVGRALRRKGGRRGQA
jgi:hypothetical protein